MNGSTRSPSAIGNGLVAGFARHRRDDGLEHARGAAARPRAEHRAGARHRQGRSGIKEFEDDLAAGALQRPLALGLRHRLGRRCAACSARPGLSPRARDRRPRRRDLGQRPGHAARARDRPAVVFWGKEEVAIDLFHHAVYAIATGAGVRADRPIG